MMNMLLDLISRVYANVLMFLMGDARLEISTVMSVICGGSILVGILALVWFTRPSSAPPSPPPGTTIIVQQSTTALMMVVVLFVMFGGILVIYLAR
ncbi:MAG: hypothetical protein GC179_09010 [Anaerolineaceae bacterium]|nr:hypothetical protein [Anaerolineaceae bacterium]